MKTTKLNLVLICVLAFMALSIGGYAQDKDVKDKKTPEERAKIGTDKLKSTLKLSDEQYTKLYDLKVQRIKDFQGFKESQKKLKADREKNNAEYKNSLKSFLSDEQMKALKDRHKDKKFKKHHKKHHNRKL